MSFFFVSCFGGIVNRASCPKTKKPFGLAASVRNKRRKGHPQRNFIPSQILWAIFRLEAFRGFSLKFSSLTSFFTWVAKLQGPFAHFTAGSQ